MLRTRIVTALILILLLIALWNLPAAWSQYGIAALLLGCWYEAAALQRSHVSLTRIMVILMCLAWSAALWHPFSDRALYASMNVLGTLWGMITAYVLLQRHQITIFLTVGARWWIQSAVFLLTGWIALSIFQRDNHLFIEFLILQATQDTAAYAVGRCVGRTPLASALSPKKTWEGFVGGCVATACLGGYGFGTSGAFLGIALASLGTIGDLWQSALKRMAGVKDSGHVLPGHGGLYDRMDSHLASIPLLAWWFLT